MIQWHIVDSSTYAAGAKVAGDLYFLSDTHEIYRGEQSFTESVILYETLPVSSIATNRLYINSATLEGKIHDGTEWKTVIKPVDTAVTTDGVNPVTGAAVASYVSAKLAESQLASDVVSSITWEAADHLMTVAMKDGTTTEEIVLDGLGVSLSYVPSTGSLQLLDASGNQIGDAVSLPLEQFVKSGEYDAATQSIILYFDDEKTNSVTIPVGALVDTYTAGDTSSVAMSVSDNKFTATVKLSSESGNQLVIKDDGVYVAAADLSDYMTLATGAVEGHIATLDASGQVIDSGKSFEDLASTASIYEGATLEAAVEGQTAKAGDVAIVTEAIGDGTKVQKTAYQYDGENWKAFDGNYNAENVYFGEDLTTTVAIGNITLTNGQGTVAAANKNLKEVWNTIFVQPKNPTTTQPSVTVSKPTAATLEVGTVYTPTYMATLNAGSYTYGPDTGITAKSWSVTDTAGHSSTTNSGSFDAFTVGDSTNYRVTATASYDDGATPVNNLGTEYSAGKIVAGSKTGYSGYIKGFRKGFWGYSLTAVALSDITSDMIRDLQNSSSGAMANNSKGSVAYPAETKAVIIAYPATLRDLSSVIDVGGMNAEISKAHDTTVDVEGANGYEAISYKVTVYSFAGDGASAANTYNFTV